jgi:GNAT superfamily N-acetyltransferase
MKHCSKTLSIESVGKLQLLTLSFLQFRFFWESENGSALIFGRNPRWLVPFIAIPYTLGWVIYNHGGKRYFVRLGEQVVAVFTLSMKHESIIISSLGVSPEYRRIGIGLFILSEVEKLCRGTKAEWLELSVLKDNMPARRLYERFGFTIAAEKRWSFILRKRIQANSFCLRCV